MSNDRNLSDLVFTFQDYLSLYSDLHLSFCNLEFMYSNLKPDTSELSLAIKSKLFIAIETLKSAKLLLESSIPDIKASITL